MNIDKFEEDIKKCRFCFMCRHLSAVGNVTFREADTPRIRSSMIWGGRGSRRPPRHRRGGIGAERRLEIV